MKNYAKDIIGLAFCLLAMHVLLRLFPFTELLIIIPALLFVISVFIKKPVWAILINTLTLLPFIILYLGIRVPSGKSIVIESKIRYETVDFGQIEGIRDRIEYRLNNRRIFLADPVNGIQWIYVNNRDFRKLWPEPPSTMNAKNDTIKARFKTYKLLNGDYSKARVMGFEKVGGDPIRTK